MVKYPCSVHKISSGPKDSIPVEKHATTENVEQYEIVWRKLITGFVFYYHEIYECLKFPNDNMFNQVIIAR